MTQLIIRSEEMNERVNYVLMKAMRRREESDGLLETGRNMKLAVSCRVPAARELENRSRN